MIEEVIEVVLIRSARLLAGAQARREGCGPSAERRIYVANHSSHLDFVLLSSALPGPLRRRTRPVAAAEYWTSGPMRRCLIQAVFRCVLLGRERFQLNPLEPVAGGAARRRLAHLLPGGHARLGRKAAAAEARHFSFGALVSGSGYCSCVDRQFLPHPSERLRHAVPLLSSVTFGTPLRWKEGQPQEEFLAEVRAGLNALRPRQ